MSAIRQELLREVYHDHQHFGRMFSDLKETFRQVVIQDLSLTAQPDSLHTAVDDLKFLIEEMIGHFEFEEQVVFKIMTDSHPECEPEVDKLRSSHDKICQSLCDLNNRLKKDPAEVEKSALKIYESLSDIFKTVEAHGEEEDILFTSALDVMSDEDCVVLMEALKSV